MVFDRWKAKGLRELPRRSFFFSAASVPLFETAGFTTKNITLDSNHSAGEVDQGPGKVVKHARYIMFQFAALKYIESF